MPAPGDILGGKYRLGRVLGEGGMATVFAAENTWTGRRVAIKTIHPGVMRVRGVLERFRIEARAASQVRHPNVIDVLDLGVDTDSGMPFIVQEFLDGETLQVRLDRLGDRTLPPHEAVALTLPIVDALTEAHAQSVVHRDMKPSNVFLARVGDGPPVPKVIDFGISKLLDGGDQVSFRTQTGMQLGTPSYMSPEQARGDSDIDGLTDVWSVGVLLYELLVRRLPHEAATNNLVLARIIYEPPTPIQSVGPAIPDNLAGIVHRALAPDRAQRWPSMLVFGEALRAWLSAQDGERTRQIRVPFAPLAVELPEPVTEPAPADAAALSLAGDTLAAEVAFPPAPVVTPSRETQVAWAQPPVSETPRRHPIAWVAALTLALVAVAVGLSLRGAPTPRTVAAPVPRVAAAPAVLAAPAVVAAPAVLAAPAPRATVAPAEEVLVAPTGPHRARDRVRPVRRAPRAPDSAARGHASAPPAPSARHGAPATLTVDERYP